jgi:hypothetical protein
MGTFAEPGLQALVPYCRQFHHTELCSSSRVILARLWPSRTHLSAVVPSLHAGSPASDNPPVAPRPAVSSHHFWPALTPRFDPRAEPRHRTRRAIQATPAGPSGSDFTLKTGLGERYVEIYRELLYPC